MSHPKSEPSRLPLFLFCEGQKEGKMYFYQFNIGDYQSHTGHLDEFEDLAYRRMLDWCYLHEKPLPANIDEIARLIRMRSHSESIANVLREFFQMTNEGYWSERVGREIDAVNAKSEKAKASANARWKEKHNQINGLNVDADAMRTHSESNATHNTRPITQDTKPKKTKVQAVRPDDVSESVWNDFVAIRNKINKPFTETALKIIRREAAKAGYTIEQALETCCARGWQGFEAKWVVEKQTEAERVRDQMHQLTRGLATPKPQPFWAKTEPVEVIPNVEPKRLL